MFFIEHFRGVSPVSVHGRSVFVPWRKGYLSGSHRLHDSIQHHTFIALYPSRRQETQLSIDMIYVVTKLKESIFHKVLGRSACLDVLQVMGMQAHAPPPFIDRI